MNYISRPELPRKQRLLIVFGTRPEALKCFPVATCRTGSSRS